MKRQHIYYSKTTVRLHMNYIKMFICDGREVRIEMTKIIAHRGACGEENVENTLETFEKAILLGADMVEFDVRHTKDNVLVVYHNRNLGDLPIDLTLYDALEQEANRQGFHLPIFREVVELCHGRTFMDIEFKEHGFEKQAIKILHELADYDEYSIKSFDDNVPYTVKEIDSNITTGLLTGCKKANVKKRLNELFPVRRLRACKADFISPYAALMRMGFITRMHRAGYPVYVWTVNNEKLMRIYLFKKIDGIITDRPDVAMRLRDKRKK